MKHILEKKINLLLSNELKFLSDNIDFFASAKNKIDQSFLVPSVSVFALFLLLVNPSDSLAEELPLTGTCGNGCLYEITTDSVTGKQNLRVYNDPNYTGTIKNIADNAFASSGTDPNKNYQENYTNTNFDKITIDGDFDTIGTRAFWHNGAEEVVFNGTINLIGTAAFEYNNLTNINLPEGLKKIKNEAFYGNSLTSLIIPDSVTDIAGYSFRQSNDDLEEIYISDTLEHLGSTVPFGSNSDLVFICKGDIEKCKNLVKNYKLQGSANPTDFSDHVFAADKFQCTGEKYFWNGISCVREPDKTKRTCCNSCKNIGNNTCSRVRYTPAEAAEVVGETNTIFLFYK